jgi:4-aminobutyrate aminotransferase / (S)-3-amino-2-methylpropionate transaminase / 5-aminovalerate transaminase
VAIQRETETARVLGDRDRYVPRGISTTPLVVARAEGARIWDVEGRAYVDFAGGIACQNTGHGFPPAVAAIHEQVDRFLHQCFMVGLYEPYIAVAEKLDDLWPGGAAKKTLLVNSGAEAVENAVKIARAATGRPAIVVFENSFHGRTLLTMAMTGNVKYKRGFGPFPSGVHRVPAPYPYRGVTSDDAISGLERLFRTDVEPEAVACVVLEVVQGEGGFVVMPPDFPARLRELCDRHGILYVDDEVQAGVGRTGPVWAIERYGAQPDLLVSGKSLGGGLPLAGVTGRAQVMDAVEPGGLGGTFSGNPVSCAAAIAVLDEVATPEFRARADHLAARLRERLDAIAGRVPAVGEVRGLGPMVALELVADETTKDPAGEVAKRTVELARERGLVLLACGLFGNVIRVLPPIPIADEELEEGLDTLEESLVDAGAGAR